MKKFIILSATVFSMFSCGSDDSGDTEQVEEEEVAVVAEPSQEEEEVPPVVIVAPENSSVTYDADVAPLIASRCFRCHNDPTANGAPSRSTWINFDIVSANAARINARVANGSMPPSGGLAQAERDVIAQWIAGGMLRN